MTATTTGRGSRRGIGIVAAVAAGLVVLALVVGRPAPDLPPLDPRSHQPDGTSALMALLRQLDVHVELSVGLPTADDAAALVLVDRLAPDQRDDLLAWVERGGRLVVTDPGSPLAPAPARGADAADAGLGLGEDPGPVAAGACDIGALAGRGDIDPGPVAALRVGPAVARCYGTADAALVVAETLGSGTIVTVGAPGILVNGRLDRAGNAAVAVALLDPGPGATVRVVDPPAPVGAGDQDLASLVPDGVRRALLQLGVAFVLYAAWRAIRLGRPVIEEQPVALAGSELVGATGRLLAGAGVPGAAAEALRADLRRAVATRLGVPAGTAPDALTDVVAARTGLEPATLVAALGPGAVRTDEQLVAVARAVATVRQEVL